MKFRSTLLLGLILAVLCGAYFGMQHWRVREARQAAEAKKKYSFEADEVQALEIHRLNESPCAAERATGKPWVITQPDPSIVPLQLMWDRVAQYLALLTNERTISEQAGDAAQYGLDEPALKMEARLASGKVIRLKFGKLDPTESYRYAQEDDGGIFLAAKNSFFELDRSLNDLRDRFLLNDRESPLVRFEFARIWTGRKEAAMENPPPVGTESVAVVLDRAAKDAPWRMRAPVDAPADQEKVEELVKQVQYAMGEGFVDKPASLSEYGLDPACFRITVADVKDGTPQTVFIGDKTEEKTGKVYARRADRNAVFLVDGNLINLFPHSPDAFRERRLVTRSASAIKKVDYRARDGNAFVLEKEAQGGWKVSQPEIEEVSPVAISDYIAAFKWVVCSSFPGGTPEQYGLNDPDVTISLTYEGEETPGVLRFKPAPNDATGSVYATQDTGEVVMLSKEGAGVLMADATRFRSRQLMRFSKADVQKIEFQLENQGYVLEKAHDQWVVKQPENKLLENQSDAAALVDALAQLNAVGEVNNPPEAGALGLDAPVFTVYVTTRPSGDVNAQGTRLGPLTVGKTDPENSVQRYATSAGHPGVFRIKQELIDTVRETCKGIRDQ
ncbi:MAG TPA: DUF4340 domain-containing protein [Candidatus Hydrogenedentes bacterium]|nr:DUF4340 domain-containing protein [Candidatus Hydrogenedentota bacterium]